MYCDSGVHKEIKYKMCIREMSKKVYQHYRKRNTR